MSYRLFFATEPVSVNPGSTSNAYIISAKKGLVPGAYTDTITIVYYDSTAADPVDKTLTVPVKLTVVKANAPDSSGPTTRIDYELEMIYPDEGYPLNYGLATEFDADDKPVEGKYEMIPAEGLSLAAYYDLPWPLFWKASDYYEGKRYTNYQDWAQPAAPTEITGLAAGDYLIRYAGVNRTRTFPSVAATATVGYTAEPRSQLKVNSIDMAP